MGKKIEHGLEMEGGGGMSYIRRLLMHCKGWDEGLQYRFSDVSS